MAVAIERATLRWLDTVVIGQKLCPFASPFRSPVGAPAKPLRVHVSTAPNTQALIGEVGEEAAALADGTAPGRAETTLIVLPTQGWLAEWRAFVHESWELQAEAIAGRGLEEKVQIVLFHPLAMHETYGEAGDAADYTIRSPYPTVHLLRTSDIFDAVRRYSGAEQIPVRNKLKFREQGIDECKSRLDRCTAA
eukprot:TRINITY_DN5546_c0_g1_i2.p1 TRINITY_DN5546_c0_g1~~TRINITY_DN5546_c0_g1_i2.p1  ORF type:complete len:208 (+),score=59.13 TRINITY_DN5546_c0_g1_i2:47-625(+)